MRVILDTNVFVSAAVSRGAPHRVLNAWFERRPFDLVVCPTLLEEVAEVLSRPKLRRWISEDDAQVLVDRVAAEAEGVGDPAQVREVTRDPDDDYLIALALEQHVDALVTGDADLLEWEGTKPRVLSPADFEASIRAD